MKDVNEMNEMEFAEHLERCIEVAQRQGWTHVIDDKTDSEINRLHRKLERLRIMMKETEKFLRS